MLGKLIKHEFRATGRIMLPLFAIVLLVSCIAHFAVRGLDQDLPKAVQTLLIIVMILFVIGLMAVSVISFVLMVQRFRRNVLGDEGYLTMTLPAGVHSMLWSKIIVSVVWFAATVAVVILAVMILLFRVEYVHDMFSEAWYYFREMEGVEIANITVVLSELLINAILSGITVCLSCYSALSIGHGFARHKMLLSVVFYFVLNTLFSYLIGLIISPVLLGPIFGYEFRSPSFHVVMAVTAGIALVEGAVHYLITVWNLRHRLNLE